MNRPTLVETRWECLKCGYKLTQLTHIEPGVAFHSCPKARGNGNYVYLKRVK